jgi:hypothetical protein
VGPNFGFRPRHDCGLRCYAQGHIRRCRPGSGCSNVQNRTNAQAGRHRHCALQITQHWVTAPGCLTIPPGEPRTSRKHWSPCPRVSDQKIFQRSFQQSEKKPPPTQRREGSCSTHVNPAETTTFTSRPTAWEAGTSNPTMPFGRQAGPRPTDCRASGNTTRQCQPRAHHQGASANAREEGEAESR